MRLVISALFVSSMLAAAAAPAQAAFQNVYDVLGVIDDGSADSFGKATAVHCTNLGGTAVNVRVRAFNSEAVQEGNTITRSIPSGFTVTFATHGTLFYAEDGIMLTGIMVGRVRVVADKPSAIVCSADYVDAGSYPPESVLPRKMIRYPRADSGGEE